MGDGEFHFDKEAEDPFAAEETLSLSDLPIIADDSAQSDYSYSRDDAGDDFFEFASEDFTASTMASDIIFCGKIINIESSKDATQIDNNNQNDNDSSVLLPWLLNKHTSKPTISHDSALHQARELKDYYSGGRVSLMRSATKRRWYLLMFRMPSIRLPAEMELSDIRNRQRRRNFPARMKLPEPADGGEMMSKSNKGRRTWWLGKMFRSLGLGCGNTSQQANDVVRSFISIM